jgi:hypothetical protein
MRKSASFLLRSTLLSSILAGMLVSDAAAGSVNISFSGTVNPAPSGVTLPDNVVSGDALTGSLAYNSAQTGSNGVYSFTGPIQSFLYSIATPGYNPALFSDQYSGSPAAFTITIADTGSKGATFDLHAITIGGSEGTKTGGGFVDMLFTSSTYTGHALPQSQTAFDNAFGTTAAKLTWDPDGTGFTATIFFIDGQFVPEPSSLGLAIVAMAICTGGFVICRRKAAAVS